MEQCNLRTTGFESTGQSKIPRITIFPFLSKVCLEKERKQTVPQKDTKESVLCYTITKIPFVNQLLYSLALYYIYVKTMNFQLDKE